MELGVKRGQALRALQVNPDMTLDDVAYYAEWMQTQNPKYAEASLVGCLIEGVRPPMPHANGKQSPDIDWSNSSQVQAYMNGAYDR